MSNEIFTPIAGQTLLETWKRAKEAKLAFDIGPFNSKVKKFFKVGGHILNIPVEYQAERADLQMDIIKPLIIAESYSETKWFLNKETGSDDLFEE